MTVSSIGTLANFLQHWRPQKPILIVGSGPSTDELHRVPLDEYTIITVNGACQLLKSDIFIAMNPRLVDYDWWLPPGRAEHYILCETLSLTTLIDHCSFKRTSLRNGAITHGSKVKAMRAMTADCIYSWGTIIGTLLLILALKNIENVDMIGCDFKDIIHVHGVSHSSLIYDTHGLPDTHRNCDEQELAKITTVIDYVQDERGMKLRHYGATQLPVQVL